MRDVPSEVILAPFSSLVTLAVLKSDVAHVTALFPLWWTVPVGISIGSTLFLAAAAIVREMPVGAWFRELSGPAYLTQGPSMMVLSGGSILSIAGAPPNWTSVLMLALLLGSAWFFYRVSVMNRE